MFAQMITVKGAGMFWTRAQKRTRSSIVTAVALLALALTGCEAAATSPTGAASAMLTATPTATPTTTATPKPTANTANLPSGCSSMSGESLSRVGDLDVSQVAKALSYPDWTIPQGTPNQPLQISSSATGSPAQGAVAVGSHGTTDGYFTFSVCNLSTSQSYTLQSVSIRVASFTPYSGALSVWSPCEDGTYDAQTQSAFNGGCGGGFGTNEYLQATFPSNAGVGASVIAQVLSTSAGPNDPNPFPKLPLSLAPGHSVGMAATLSLPTTPGTYTFAFGIAVGSASPTYFSTSSPTLYAPITLDWSGQNCTTTAMKSQIPASTQHTQYICPPAA